MLKREKIKLFEKKFLANVAIFFKFKVASLATFYYNSFYLYTQTYKIPLLIFFFNSRHSPTEPWPLAEKLTF